MIFRIQSPDRSVGQNGDVGLGFRVVAVCSADAYRRTLFGRGGIFSQRPFAVTVNVCVYGKSDGNRAVIGGSKFALTLSGASGIYLDGQIFSPDGSIGKNGNVLFLFPPSLSLQ